MKYLDRIIDRYLQRLGYRKPVEIHVQPNTTTIDIPASTQVWRDAASKRATAAHISGFQVTC